MLKKLVFTILLSLFCVQTFFAQTSNQQWEYLIVSVINLGDKKDLSVSEKWMGVRQGKLSFSQEVLTQNEFDRLGKLGWELVSSIPLFDANQNLSFSSSKFIFKRLFDAERSNYEKEQQKLLLEKLKNVHSEEPEIVDLDRVESINKQNQVNNQVAGKLEQKLKSITKFKIVDIKSSAYISANNKNVRSEITVDATQTLLKDGNKFRSSEAKEFIRQVAEEVYKTVGFKPRYANEPFFEDNIYNQNGNGTFIQIKVVVNVNGKYLTVAEGKVQGIWDELKNY